MATAEDEARAEGLAAKAVHLFESGKNEVSYDEGLRTIQEAISISSTNLKVRAACQKIQEDDSVHPLLRLCQKYIVDRDDAFGREAAQLLLRSDARIPDDVGEECVKLLIDRQSATSDEILGLVLRQSLGAREYVARLLESSLTNELFERFWASGGDDATTGLVGVVLDPGSWKSQSTRGHYEKDVFKLLLANLLAPGREHITRTIKSLARLLATDVESLSPLIDADCFRTILSLLDMRLPVEVRSQATLTTAKHLEASASGRSPGQEVLTDFITSRVSCGTDDERVVAFSAAAAVFPIVPAVASALFLTEGFVESLVRLLKKQRSEEITQAALEMFSAACIDAACRKAIAKHARDWLEAENGQEMDSFAGTASVVLAKISRDDNSQVLGQDGDQNEDGDRHSVNSLVSKFVNMLLPAARQPLFRDSSSSSKAHLPERQGQRENRQDNAIEGLAYTSLNPKVKYLLASNPSFMKALYANLSLNVPSNTSSTSARPDSTAIFGLLTTINNLTVYLPNLSEEQKRIAQLKAYADPEKRASVSLEPAVLDQDDAVAKRCKAVLDVGLVPLLLKAAREPRASATNLTLIVTILLSLSREQKHRGQLAQLGAVKLLLQLHAAEYSPMTSPETLRMAAHALGRILISVDPALVFTSGSTPPIAAAVRPLVRLLDPPDSRANTADRLPTYESLLALTNLASHDAATAGAISTAMFPALDSLLLSQNTHLQRAAVELVCNTAVSPTTAAALAPGPDTPTPAAQQARQRLHILLALADAPEAATREAAGGALAMLTGWESVVEGILDRERGVSMVLGLCGEEETEAVLHRGVVAVRNMLCVEDERLAKRAKETMREAGAVEKLKAALRRSRDEEVLATGVEALKALLAP